MTSGALEVKPGENTFAAQNGAVSLTGGTVKFDTTDLDLTTGPWTIASGTSAATCSGVSLQDGSGTALTVAAGWSIAASGNNIVVTYTPPVYEPTVETGAATGIGTDGATLKATVSNNGGASLTSGGVVFSASSVSTDPTVGGAGCTNVAYGSVPTLESEFSVNVSGLTPGTQYHYKGYAVNSSDLTGYGSAGSFYTMASEPSAPVSATVRPQQLSWAAPATRPNGYLVFRVEGDTATTFVPTDGTEYTEGNDYGDATLVKISTSSAANPTFNDTGATPDTVYTYTVYS